MGAPPNGPIRGFDVSVLTRCCNARPRYFNAVVTHTPVGYRQCGGGASPRAKSTKTSTGAAARNSSARMTRPTEGNQTMRGPSRTRRARAVVFDHRVILAGEADEPRWHFSAASSTQESD